MADPLLRWRLVLGRFSKRELPEPPSGDALYARMEDALEFLYGREYEGRGARQEARQDGERDAGRDAALFTVPHWIGEVRELFPKETVEVLEKHALERYGLEELVTDAEVLRKLEPTYELLKTLLAFKGTMEGEVLQAARALVRQVVDELLRRLSSDVRPVLWGRLDRRRRSTLKVARNLDLPRTLRRNLRHWEPARRRLVPAELHFVARVDRHLPWHVVMAVDTSGSMVDSVIHAAVMAGVFAALPGLRLSLLVFDTAVVDLTEHAGDAAEVLMSVQLGGGTDIAGALEHAETLVISPTRTLLVLVTDFHEGGSPRRLVTAIRRLREAGVRVLGLAALGSDAEPAYDREMARRCAEAGAEIAALTPRRLAEWVARVIS